MCSKAPASDHQDLAAAALLGGGAEHDDRAVAGSERLFERQRRGDAGGRDQVVPTGVADVLERVVLAEDCDLRVAFAVGRPKRGLEAEGATVHGEAALLEERRQRGMCMPLLERGLRLFVDARAERA